MMPTRNKQVIQRLFASYTQLISMLLVLVSLSLLTVIPVVALPQTFDASLVLTDQDYTSLPLAYSSANQIQKYLESQGSVLATSKVRVAFESDDSIVNPATFSDKADFLQPVQVLAPFYNKEISVAEFIWRISRDDFGNSCGLTYRDLCINNRVIPLNPAIILATIQKESRLVYGACARPDADTNPACSYSSPSSINKLAFRMERATGYYCFENPDKSKSCYDENPNWRFFKGLFRQVYYAVRLLRLNEQRCQRGGEFAFANSNGTFQVGSTVRISSQNILLRNAITCSLYVYTPHISAQNLLWQILRDMGVDKDLVQAYNIPQDYNPRELRNLPINP